MRLKARHTPIALVLALALAPLPARADSFIGMHEPDYSADRKLKQSVPLAFRGIRHLAYPVLGFPSLVEPSGRLALKLLLQDGGVTRDFTATLETAASPTPCRWALKNVAPATYDTTTGVYTVEVELPASVAPAVYHLEVASSGFTLTGGRPDRQPNAVRVLKPGRADPSFVVIADTQLQDTRTTETPARLRQFLEEIRLRDPDFCLFVGDMCFGSDYASEYEENWRVFAESGLAIFCIPGNHDAYATVVPQSSRATGDVQRDGLDSWRRAMGPLTFSFDWLGHHFVGVNSMGGTPERRNANGILSANYGGLIDPPALAWIDKDVAAATARGKRSILFMHHDPAAALTPDGPSYPFAVPSFTWQQWNDKASQDALAATIAKNQVSHVLYGHIHNDRYDERTLGGRKVVYAATTTMICGSHDHFGYRWVRTNNGVVSELNYAGLSQQSVPYPATGVNVDAIYKGRRDGSEARLEAALANRLAGATDVVVELAVKSTPLGVRATGGTLESLCLSETGAWVGRVRARLAAGGRTTVALEPDTGTAGAHPAVGSLLGTPTATGGSVPAIAGSKNGPAIKLGAVPAESTASSIRVIGTATDPAGLAVVTVGGAPVTVGSGGSFAASCALKPGLNTIVVEATNAQGRRSHQAVSVVQGAFTPTGTPIQDAVAVRLNQQGLDAVARLIQGKVGGTFLEDKIKARNPLVRHEYKLFGKTIASADVIATSATVGAPTLRLTPAAGELLVHAEIPNIALGLDAHSVGGIPYRFTGGVDADKAVVDARARVTIVNGRVTTQLTTVDVSLQGFHWKLDRFPGVLTGLLRPVVQKLIENAVEGQIRSVVPPALDLAIAGALQKPIKHTILGLETTVTISPTTVTLDASGESVRAAADIAVAPVAGRPTRASLGSLATRPAVPADRTGPGFVASASQDLLNRTGHAVWRAGGIDLTFSRNGTIKLPASLPLDIGLLQTFIWQLRGKLPAGDPIEIVLAPGLPPVFSGKAAPDTLETALGNLGVDVWHAPAGGPRQLVLRLAIHVRARAKLGVDARNTLTVNLGAKPALDVSVVESPAVPDLDALGVANFVQFAVPPLLQSVANTWSGFPLPTAGGLKLRNVGVEADGANKTYIMVSGDL